MALPNVNPKAVDCEETLESYFQRIMLYLTSGNLAEMLTALEVYKNHFLPQSESLVCKPFYSRWLEAMRDALSRNIPIEHRLLVFDCLIHYFPREDVFFIAVEFLGNLSPEECAEAKKQLQDVPELCDL